MVMNLDAQYYTSGTWMGTSSTSLNATLNNGVVFSNEVGGCMYFDGYDDHALVPYSSQFEFTNGTSDLPFTMMGWFRMYDTKGGPIISKSDTGNAAYLSYAINASSTSVWMTLYNNANGANYGGKQFTASASIAPGTWCHYAISYTGSTASVYLNGSLVSHATSTWGSYARMNPTSLPIYIGSFGTNGVWHSKFRGEIGQQMIYSGALPAADIYQNYMATKGRFLATSLLDVFSGAVSAHSIRKIRSAYSGPCMRIRRSSDNAELDIAFDGAGNLSVSSILSFVGSGDGFVTKWYDQSGYGNDMAQPVASRQLRIASSGSIETLNGKPALYKHNADSTMGAQFGATYSAPNGIYSVLSITASGGDSYIASAASFRGSFASGQVTLSSSSDGSHVSGGGVSYPHSPSLSSQGVYSFNLNNAFSRASFNNARGVYGNSGWTGGSLSGLYIGATGSSQMKIQEIVAFDKDHDWNRTAISDGMNSYFSAYVKRSEKGLIAHYDTSVQDSHQGSGSVVYDISSYNNNMSLINGALVQNGGMYFNGVTSYAQSSQAISLQEAPKTFVIWMKQSNSGGGQICRIGGASTAQLFELISGSNGFTGHFWGSGLAFGVNAGKTLMNSYTHVAMTYVSSGSYNAGKTTIYVDGVEKGSFSYTLNNFNSQSFFLSQPAYSGTPYYNGYLYSVKLYDRALSAAEVLSDFNGTKSRFGL